MKRFLPLIVCIAAVGLGNSGCEPTPPTDQIAVTPKVAPSTNQVESAVRFSITSQGTFKAGYDDSVREIFILKDNISGREYLGVTDCTLIRIHKEKDEATADAIETGLDIALDAFAE